MQGRTSPAATLQCPWLPYIPGVVLVLPAVDCTASLTVALRADYRPCVSEEAASSGLVPRPEVRDEPPAVLPRVWVDSITFSDGSTLPFAQHDVVLIVGPNNSGKSEALRAIRNKVTDSAQQSLVVSNLTLERMGEPGDVVRWIEGLAKGNSNSSPDNPVYERFGTQVYRSQVPDIWSKDHLSGLSRFFCHLLNAEERLRAANPAGQIALGRDAPSHPIHFLQRDDSLEKRLSSQFRKAFGVDLIVHRNAGGQVPLYVGDRPVPKAGQDRVSIEYIRELEKLPDLKRSQAHS